MYRFKITLPIILITFSILTCVIVSTSFYNEFYVQPKEEIEKRLYAHRTEKETAIAFATALRLKHERAYDLADDQLDERIARWMDSYVIKECDFFDQTGYVTARRLDGTFTVEFGCYLEDDFRFYTLTVFRIKLSYDANGQWQVVDWLSSKERFD